MNQIKEKHIKIAHERLSEEECEVLSHMIVCDLDDLEEDGIFVYDEEKVKNNISLLITLEDVLKEENINLEKAIFDYIINCGEVDFDEENVIKEIINNCIKNRKKFHLCYKESWRRILDSLSDVHEIRELAKIENKLIQVNVDEIINRICNPHDFSTIARRQTLLLEKERIEKELIRMGLKTLF